jgi:hypothetical protein
VVGGYVPDLTQRRRRRVDGIHHEAAGDGKQTSLILSKNRHCCLDRITGFTGGGRGSFVGHDSRSLASVTSCLNRQGIELTGGNRGNGGGSTDATLDFRASFSLSVNSVTSCLNPGAGVAELRPPEGGSWCYGRRDSRRRETRSTSAALQAWASQPRCACGASPSMISGRWPRQFAWRRSLVLARMARAASTASGA